MGLWLVLAHAGERPAWHIQGPRECSGKLAQQLPEERFGYWSGLHLGSLANQLAAWWLGNWIPGLAAKGALASLPIQGQNMQNLIRTT